MNAVDTGLNVVGMNAGLSVSIVRPRRRVRLGMFMFGGPGSIEG